MKGVLKVSKEQVIKAGWKVKTQAGLRPDGIDDD